MDSSFLASVGYLMARNYQVPFAKGVFLEPSTFYGKFSEIQSRLQNPAVIL